MIWYCPTFAGPLFLLYFGLSSQRANGVFSANFCQLNCGTRVHTLCEKESHNCNYKSHKVYGDRELGNMGLRDQLILAHNGLRERIATRMHVTNMVVINWSKQLSRMAENWAKFCQPYEDDECAHTTMPMTVERLLNITKQNQLEPYIAMNRFCVKALYLPFEIIQMALHLWYFEKDYMKAPHPEAYESLKLAFLSGENNFTHLAYPLTTRIGCSVANISPFSLRYDHIFCIFCFYEPYYRHTDGVVFQYGQPSTHCPPEYPLKDLIFPSMCSRNLYLDADEESCAAGRIKASAGFSTTYYCTAIFVLIIKYN
ncbi:venom allergen 5-like isoform X2 [Anastrepha ludens]|uniref:venom allergen 5-like isoform X2 n=1 Tax=Anastrepha ludens TaxID=28586 RepID=UPI0023AFAC28|nr:venom allergen 5-like isoform X2 [Anastrepha ludens]